MLNVTNLVNLSYFYSQIKLVCAVFLPNVVTELIKEAISSLRDCTDCNIIQDLFLMYFTVASLAFSLFIMSPCIPLLLSSLHSLAGPGLLCRKVENSISSLLFHSQLYFSPWQFS